MSALPQTGGNERIPRNGRHLMMPRTNRPRPWGAPRARQRCLNGHWISFLLGACIMVCCLSQRLELTAIQAFNIGRPRIPRLQTQCPAAPMERKGN